MSFKICRTGPRRGATASFAAAIACLVWLPWGILAVSATSSRADLVLNEVLYDPAGADEGREFVELWNPDSSSVSLDGLALEAGDGARPGAWEIVWQAAPGSVAAARSAYLVAGSALVGALQNGPDAVRLVRGSVVVDLLGYGDLETATLYEGAPAADPTSGQSLARVADGVDTGTNRDDWAAEGEPTPGFANRPDVRLRISRSGVLASPEVAWPGEMVTLSAWVRNLGRLALDETRWIIEAEVAADSSGVWAPVVSAPGIAVAPAESVFLSLSFAAAPPGPAIARLCLRDPAGAAGATSGVAPLADTVAVPIRSIAGPAVVSEIAFQDAGADEWVEIWFREAIADVGELSIADASATPRRIDRGAEARHVEAGRYLVIAQDPALVRARFGLPDSTVYGVAGGWPSLNDTGGNGAPADRVRIVDAAGVPCDAVPYHAGSSARGGSLERLSFDLPSAASGTWAESIDPGRGTPGRENSMRAPGAVTAARGPLLVAGARVLRRKGGAAVPVVLRVTAAALGRRLTVRVHDLLGRPLRTLVEGQRCTTEATFLWDGRDDRGDPVPAGIYVIRAEVLPEDGAGARASSVPLAVAAEPAR